MAGVRLSVSDGEGVCPQGYKLDTYRLAVHNYFAEGVAAGEETESVLFVLTASKMARW